MSYLAAQRPVNNYIAARLKSHPTYLTTITGKKCGTGSHKSQISFTFAHLSQSQRVW
jgi:hypothetical protein